MRYHHVSTLASIATLFISKTAAWLPEQQKELLSVSGANLFNITTPPALLTLNATAENTTNGTHNATLTPRWTPYTSPIRGVNLGSLFVFEPWMASQTWARMGCDGLSSEFDCVLRLGRDRADEVFQGHWDSWITQNDIAEMRSYGLNTIRIPVGYWMFEDITYDSEFFPRGGITYLERVCGWAADAGFYVIIDMHGAPGAQIPRNSFTGQYAPSAGFYVDWQYARAQKFLVWLTTKIHTSSSFRNVGMLGLVNEPLQDPGVTQTLRSQFYPQAYAAIREAERSLGKGNNDFLHIQVMNELWGAGNPNEFMTDRTFLAYEDHRYPKWDSAVQASQGSYLQDSCTNHRARDNLGGPTIVTEFSISPADSVEWQSGWGLQDQKDFYRRWFAAQVGAYEQQTAGWVFWSWKTELGDDYRWSYQKAVESGVIPRNIADYDRGACAGM